MAPPRHHHHHGNNQHHTPDYPFPALGVAGNQNSASPLHHSAYTHSNGSSNFDGTGMHSLDSSSASGLPPAPNKVDASQAQACRLQDAYWSDEEEDMDCPLCLEEIDLSDANFKPCPCGYQICRFCWHHIKQNLNGRCPACRRKYSDNTVEFKAMSQDEIKKLSQAKKQKEREKKELEQMNRKHLANMRVVQKNLVYVVGLDPKLAKEELIPTLRSNEFFGQYGRISKILISKRTTASKLIMGTHESAIGVYVTYVRKEDAARAIVAIDGSKGPDGKTIRASYGTTKYCTNYLRNLPCTNNICTYLHEPGEEADSFTKEDLSTLRHAAKDTEHKTRPVPPPASFSTGGSKGEHHSHQQQHASAVLTTAESIEASALPKTASWASTRPGGSNGAAPASPVPAAQNAVRDQELPPLSAVQSLAQSGRKGSGQQGKFSSPLSSKTSTTKNRAPPTAAAESRRSESPMPSDPASPASTSSNLPSAPPGLLTKQTSKTLISNEALEEVSGPKGSLAPASRPSPPSHNAETVSTLATATPKQPSMYQPSSKAQALLDDMRSRRAAEAFLPSKSPFPDFDATLSSFRDGDDFCFTLEQSQIPANLKESSSNGAFSAFSPFPMNVHGSYYDRATATPPPPPGMGTPMRASSSASASAPPPPPGLFGAMGGGRGYSGPFDPFAPDAGEVLPSFGDDKAEGLGSRLKGNEEEGRLSRFDFSKRRDSPDEIPAYTSANEARGRQQQLQHPNQAQYLELGAPNNSYDAHREEQHPLLAQLLNYRPATMEGVPFNDPAIMSYARQQQQQQHHHQQQQQQNSPPSHHQEPYLGAFNPFDSSQTGQGFRANRTFA